MLKRLLMCFALLAFCGASQDAFAGRFGLQTGLYNEGIKTPYATTREFGLRLGFYADRTTNDILYAAAVNGNNLYGMGEDGCGCGAIMASGGTIRPGQRANALGPAACGCARSVQPVGNFHAAAAATPCGCNTIRPVSCAASTRMLNRAMPGPAVSPSLGMAPAAAPSKTEIYLLVLPQQNAQPQVRPTYQVQPTYQMAAPQMVAPSRPVADYRMSAPRGYYQEPEEQRPVRGLW